MSNGGGSPAPVPANIVALGPALLLKGVVLPSFAQFAVTGEDNIQIKTVGSIAGATVQIQGRFLDAAQQAVLPFSWAVPVGSDAFTVTTQTFPLGTGYLLNLTAFVTGATPQIGQVFVIVQIIRGISGATFLLGTLLQGYVTSTQGLGWPGSPIQNSRDSKPRLRTIVGTTPAVGVEISETCPSGVVWLVRGVRMNLTASANVATRTAGLDFFNGSTGEDFHIPGSSVVAGQVGNHFFSHANAQAVETYNPNLLYITGPLNIAQIMRPGDFFQSITAFFQPNDQWGAPKYFVEELLEVL